MTFGEQAFEAMQLFRATHGGVVIRPEWIKVIDDLYAKIGPASRKKKTTAQMSDEEWIVSLETEPALAGVGVRTELAKAQFWCKNNSRKCSRRFFVNWLGKAERIVTHAGGKSVVRTDDIYTEPTGWRTCEAARAALKFSVEIWANICAKEWANLSPDLRASILRALL